MEKDLARIRKDVFLEKIGLADKVDYIERYKINSFIIKEYNLILNNKFSWSIYRIARKTAKIWHLIRKK